MADPGLQASGDVEGFVVVAGPDVRRGCVSPRISALDAAPLALDLMGFPASAEMPGRLPAACLVERADRPPRVTTYGLRAASQASSATSRSVACSGCRPRGMVVHLGAHTGQL